MVAALSVKAGLLHTGLEQRFMFGGNGRNGTISPRASAAAFRLMYSTNFSSEAFRNE